MFAAVQPSSAVREMRIHGAVVAADLPRLRDYLDEAVALAPVRLVVDLSTCPSLHEDAIRALVRAQEQLGTTGGVVDLRATTQDVRQQLRVHGVDDRFTHSPAKATAAVVPIR